MTCERCIELQKANRALADALTYYIKIVGQKTEKP